MQSVSHLSEQGQLNEIDRDRRKRYDVARNRRPGISQRTAQILGHAWQANGVAGNQAVIDTFAGEMHARGITGQRIPMEAVFARFEEMSAS